MDFTEAEVETFYKDAGLKRKDEKVIYNFNDHSVEVKITIPSNTGFELDSIVEEINKFGFTYAVKSQNLIGIDRIETPTVEVRIK